MKWHLFTFKNWLVRNNRHPIHGIHIIKMYYISCAKVLHCASKYGKLGALLLFLLEPWKFECWSDFMSAFWPKYIINRVSMGHGGFHPFAEKKTSNEMSKGGFLLFNVVEVFQNSEVPQTFHQPLLTLIKCKLPWAVSQWSWSRPDKDLRTVQGKMCLPVG